MTLRCRGSVTKIDTLAPEHLHRTLTINIGSDDFYEVELVATGTNGDEVRVELSRRPE
jgi:hypothetical protein